MWWLTRGIKRGKVNHTEYCRKAEIARESSEAGFQRAGGEDNEDAIKEALVYCKPRLDMARRGQVKAEVEGGRVDGGGEW